MPIADSRKEGGVSNVGKIWNPWESLLAVLEAILDPRSHPKRPEIDSENRLGFRAPSGPISEGVWTQKLTEIGAESCRERAANPKTENLEF